MRLTNPQSRFEVGPVRPTSTGIMRRIDTFDPIYGGLKAIGADNMAGRYLGGKTGLRTVVTGPINAMHSLEASIDRGWAALASDPSGSLAATGTWIKNDLPQLPGRAWNGVTSAAKQAGADFMSSDPLRNERGANVITGAVGSLYGPATWTKVKLFGRAGGAAESIPINGASRTVPLGFEAETQFHGAALELRDTLRASGITDANVGVRGSSVTGSSFRTGQPFGPASDIDFFVESGQLTQAYKASRNIPGFVHPNKILNDYPMLSDWSQKWTGILGRDVTPGAFQPGTLPSHPAILVK